MDPVLRIHSEPVQLDLVAFARTKWDRKLQGQQPDLDYELLVEAQDFVARVAPIHAAWIEASMAQDAVDGAFDPLYAGAKEHPVTVAQLLGLTMAQRMEVMHFPHYVDTLALYVEEIDYKSPQIRWVIKSLDELERVGDTVRMAGRVFAWQLPPDPLAYIAGHDGKQWVLKAKP